MLAGNLNVYVAPQLVRFNFTRNSVLSYVGAILKLNEQLPAQLDAGDELIALHHSIPVALENQNVKRRSRPPPPGIDYMRTGQLPYLLRVR